jgi:hypothetical protein
MEKTTKLVLATKAKVEAQVEGEEEGVEDLEARSCETNEILLLYLIGFCQFSGCRREGLPGEMLGKRRVSSGRFECIFRNR